MAETPLPLLLAIFMGSLWLGFTGAMMPGPLLMVTVSETGRRGFRQAPLLVLGHGIIELAVVVGLAVGLGEFLGQGPVKAAIALFGGLFLLWMGYGIVRASWLQQVSLTNLDGTRSARGGPVLAGLLTSVSNPYWVIWWATAGAAAIMISLGSGVAGLVSFYSGHILSDLLWYSLMGLAVVSGRRVMGDGLYRGILLVCGAFLIVLAGWFLWSAPGFWQG